jgi:hypothetical protein
MMAISEERPDQDRAITVKTVALSTLLGMIVLLSMGVVAGAGFALLDGSSKQGRAILIIAVGLAAGLAALVGLMRLKPWAGSGEPMSPKTRKANKMLALAALLGGLFGAALSISTVSMDNPWALFSNSPMSPWIVIPAIAVWLSIVPAISWQWHRSIDEHEAEAYKFGGVASLYLYAFLTPAWWLAWRAGLVPAPETMVIYLLVISVFGIGWFWRRSR